jgi:hypothetical protein
VTGRRPPSERVAARSKPETRGLRSVALAGLALAACASPDPLAQDCAGTSAEALVNAASDESYLGIGGEQIRALVPIVDATDPKGPLCSGTLVTREWVVTARHCLRIEPAEVWIGGEPDSVDRRPVVTKLGHPTLDVGLVRIAERDQDDSEAVVPIDTASPGELTLANDEVAEIAGYGVTESGDLRELRFLAERVVATDETTITVGGFGLTGACNGDSGGPLLVRAPDGKLVVAGVLTGGSASCRDEDTYVRLDTVRSWIDETIGVHTNPYLGCGTITAEGRCLYGSALWCSATELSAEHCAEGTTCGWDTTARGFRCVRPFRDPCGGVDGVGVCRDGVPMRCVGGKLERDVCACGRACGIEGTTGAPYCTFDSAR